MHSLRNMATLLKSYVNLTNDRRQLLYKVREPFSSGDDVLFCHQQSSIYRPYICHKELDVEIDSLIFDSCVPMSDIEHLDLFQTASPGRS